VKTRVEALTAKHLKAGEELVHVNRAHEAQLNSLDERFNNAEAITQATLNRLWGEVAALREDLTQALSQCKQTQSAKEPRLKKQSKQTKANTKTLPKDILPTFIYSYKFNTDQLHRTSLVTGEQSIHRVPSYTFKRGCCWSEVPGGSLLITGGGDPIAVSEVVRIDVGTFEVSPQPPMLTPRLSHAAVYHTEHLYVLGGFSLTHLSECERYSCTENRWEALPPLPRACCDTVGVVVETSLYALGGRSEVLPLYLVQKLNLESLKWQCANLWLPAAGYGIPCFKLSNTEVYLVLNKTLCSFTAFEVRPLKTLTEDILNWYGASYYHRGTLYCSDEMGAVRSLEIGSLSN
jgi:hypothetical protein